MSTWIREDIEKYSVALKKNEFVIFIVLQRVPFNVWNWVCKRLGLLTHLTAHRVGIDLTHVGTGVILLDIRHVQFPRVVPIVRDR